MQVFKNSISGVIVRCSDAHPGPVGPGWAPVDDAADDEPTPKPARRARKVAKRDN